tara:strand:+ start:409 stop:1368 length:960 start_codon:yes stop_codon:yes gene_type:complete
MASKLEHEIHFNKHDDQSSDDKWSLYEVNEAGVQIGADWKPWKFSLSFSAIDLQLVEDLNTESMFIFSFEDENFELNPELSESSKIFSMLQLSDSNRMDFSPHPPNVSFLGTSRSIKDFRIHIHAASKGKDGFRIIRGLPSYEISHGLEDHEDHEDNIEIDIEIAKDKYAKLARQITEKTISSFEVTIGAVKGLYAQPFIHDEIKVLCSNNDHKVIGSNNSDFCPYRLMDIGELRIRVITKGNLAASESVRSSDIQNAFDDDTFQWDELDGGLFGIESLRTTNALIAKVVSNQQELLKLKLPLWIGVSALCLLLIKLWA